VYIPAACTRKITLSQNWVVDLNHSVHFQDLTLRRDNGAQIEIESRLADGDIVFLNPTGAIRDGVTVEPSSEQPRR
jgi:hypothetical protein